jgi:glycerol-3-phosphate acyltransferase PlsY
MWMWIACALLVAAYLLGSISGSLLLGRLRGVDIRTQGSGNAGGTNALRTQGWRFALGVVLIDVGKGALAAWLASRAGFAPGPMAFAAILAAMAGHIWPVFHGFRGGKGAATLVGGLAVAWPLALVPVLATWVVCLVLTGYVGLSTVLAALALAGFAAMPPVESARLAFAIVVAVLIAYTHRDNLRRLRAGTESRFERARLFHRALRRPQ